MVWWTAAAGALIGLAVSGYGLFLGAVLGLMMGAWLQGILRREIAQEVERAMSGFEPSLAAEPARWSYQEQSPPPDERPQEGTHEPEGRDPPPAVIALEQPPIPEAAETETWTAPGSRFEETPDLAERLISQARGWLLGGNTIVRAGLVVLFIGLVFLARLVVNAGLFPIEARLASVGAVGAVLLGVGYWKRLERPDFALHLQGGGVAVLYLTVFAAARVFGVMVPGAAFAFMILFAALGASLAVLQNSLTMALASFLGGFAVPLLLGGNAETPLGLFAYLSVLNLAIMGIAWKKSWRALNLLGFFATFAMASAWGLGSYEARHFTICEAFLGLSVAIYLATALLYAHNTPGRLGNFADSTLLFGTAIAGFGLQAGLVHDRPYASAWSAVGLGAVYLALAAWAMKRRDKGMALLSECLLAIGAGFVTMAIPLALDLRWTSAAWALEGAGAFWVGARQARWMPRAAGLALQLAGAAIVVSRIEATISPLPLVGEGVMAALLIALPMLVTAWQLRAPLPHSGSSLAQSWSELEKLGEKPWFLMGFGFVVLAFAQEISRQLPAGPGQIDASSAYPADLAPMLLMAALVGVAALSEWFGRRRSWRVAIWPSRLGLPVIAWTFLISLTRSRNVLDLPDLAIWAGVLAIHFWLLKRSDADTSGAESAWNRMIHAAGVWLITAMTANALAHLIDLAELWNSSWSSVIYLVAGTMVLGALTRWGGRAAPLRDTSALAWPLHPHARAYWWRAAAPLALVLYIGTFGAALFAQGITQPLPYLPLLNPIDLTAALVLVYLGLWRKCLARAHSLPGGAKLVTAAPALGAGGLLAFALINAVWMRSAHHYLGVGWSVDALLSSQVVLTGFSILWTLIAMGLMLFANRRAQRLPWLVGAGLLGAVVAKLLLIDISAVQGIARILAFIAVGALMLLIGYFVPLPPREQDKEN